MPWRKRIKKIRSGNRSALAEFTWGFAEAFFVCAREGGVVLEPAFIADFRDRFPGEYKVTREQQPLCGQVIPDAVAGLLFEGVHEVGAA